MKVIRHPPHGGEVRGNAIAGALRTENAQMSVELAVVMPACIIMVFVVVNLMLFIEASVSFDRIAAAAILAHGVSLPGSGRGNAEYVVQSAIEEALGRRTTCSVEVDSSKVSFPGGGTVFDAGPSLTRFTCTLHYRPWPSGFVIAGVAFQVPAILEHRTDLVIDAYRSGVVF